jgi:hypothetical protein
MQSTLRPCPAAHNFRHSINPASISNNAKKLKTMAGNLKIANITTTAITRPDNIRVIIR